jgi:hypothetical protein
MIKKLFILILIASCTTVKPTTVTKPLALNRSASTLAITPLDNTQLTIAILDLQDSLAAMKHNFTTDSLVVTSSVYVGRPNTTYSTLDGGGYSVTGIIVSYFWQQISGASRSYIEYANHAVTRVFNLIMGTYQFELTVTDDKGQTGKDTTQIIVSNPLSRPSASKEKVVPVIM